MKYVLDASVGLSWVMPRPLTSKALALRDEFRNHVHEAPSTFGAEVAFVIHLGRYEAWHSSATRRCFPEHDFIVLESRQARDAPAS